MTGELTDKIKKSEKIKLEKQDRDNVNKRGSGKGGRRGRRTKNMINIANERIEILFEFAEHERGIGKYDRLDRYVELARKIGMRYNVRIPLEHKRKFCKHCYSYLHPGRTADVRIRKKTMIVQCKNCNNIMRKVLK
jgi:ribonuclease P protein subunit RPR2